MKKLNNMLDSLLGVLVIGYYVYALTKDWDPLRRIVLDVADEVQVYRQHQAAVQRVLADIHRLPEVGPDGHHSPPTGTAGPQAGS